MKEDIRAAALAVILVVAGLFWWQVTTLVDCRDAIRQGSSPSDPLSLECPPDGPYGTNSNLFLFALQSPFFPAAAAGGKRSEAGRETGRRWADRVFARGAISTGPKGR